MQRLTTHSEPAPPQITNNIPNPAMAAIPPKHLNYAASRAPVIECRDTSKSYMVAYSILQALANRNPESMVEVIFKNDKGILKDLSVWCEATGNELVSSDFSEDEKEIRALIEKGVGMERRNSEVASSMRGGGRKHLCLLISTLIWKSWSCHWISSRSCGHGNASSCLL